MKPILRENLIPATRAQIRAMSGIIVSTDNGWKVSHKNILAFDEFNMRTDYGDIPELGTSILRNGLLVPFKGDFMVDKTDKKQVVYFVITDGFRRKRGIAWILSEGNEVGLLPCQANEKGISVEERIYQMFVTQDNKKLTEIEVSAVFRELVNLGNDTKKIAAKVSKSETYVKDMLILSKLPESVKNAIKSKRTTATAAVMASKSVGPDRTAELVQNATQNNKKFDVGTAQAIAEEQKAQEKIQYERVFQIPETIEGMEIVEKEILALPERTEKQLKVLRQLQTKLQLARERKNYENTATDTVLDRPSPFNTRLETKFKSTFCDQLEQGLCHNIWLFFKTEVESEL